VKVSPQLRGLSPAELIRAVKRGLAYVEGDTLVPVASGAAPALFVNDAEAQASGTAVALDGTNTGDAASVAFTGAAVGANMTLTFDNAHAAHGANAYKAALTSTATAATYVFWSGFTAMPHVYGAAYIYLTATPVSSVRICQFFLSGGLIGSWFINSGGPTAQFRSAADAAIGTASVSITLNAWTRIEYDILFGASGTATGKLFVYDGDSTSQKGTAADLGANAFGTSAGADQARFGICTANLGSTAGLALWFDDINLNDTGVPGPGPYSAVPVQPPALQPRRMPLGV